MTLQVAIASGQSRATSINKMENLVDYGLAIGTSAGLVTYDDLRSELNTLAGVLSLPTFDPAVDDGGAIRTKINAINSALALDVDLSLRYDAIPQRYWDGGPLAPSSEITDIHAQAIMVPDGSGGWVSRAIDTLCFGPDGHQTVPTRTNSLRNNSGTGAVPGAPGTMPTNWAVGAGAGLTRNVIATGTEFGLPYVDFQFVGSASSTVLTVAMDSATAIAALTGQVWTGSVRARLVAVGVNVPTLNFRITEHDAGGASLVTGNGAASALTTSIALFDYTRTLNQATTAFARPWLAFGLVNGQSYDFTVRVYAPQFAQGAFATPPILTTNAAVTRNGNVVSLPGIDMPNGFSFYWKGDILGAHASAELAAILSIGASDSDRLYFTKVNTGNNLTLTCSVGNVDQGGPTLAGAFATGSQVLYGTIGPGYARFGKVGVGDSTVGVLGGYFNDAAQRINLLSSGYGLTRNTYGITEEFAIKVGTADADAFESIKALAQAA